MLLSRQRQLLSLLDVLGGSVATPDFQNLLFLYCQEPDSGRPYDFVPHRFGAYSFTSHADRRKLIERGLVVDEEPRWNLSDAGRAAVGQARNLHLAAFVRGLAGIRGDALAAETYRRFPYVAIRSEIAGRVLRGDGDALARIEAARPQGRSPHVATIGYQGHTLESYLNRLSQAGVSILCDVRRNPLSRKYGFSKGTLASGCDGVGIRYEHLPQLGIASDKRQNLDSQAAYDALFDEYEREWLPQQGESLARIAGWVRAGQTVALTCYEQLPQQCHRHCVAEALDRDLGHGFTATHL